MIKVTKDTIYLYDELNNRQYLLYRKDISYIELIEYKICPAFDISAWKMTIFSKNFEKFFLTVNEQTVIADVMDKPYSQVYKEGANLASYSFQLGERKDYLEKVIDSSSETIKEIFEELVKGNDNFEVGNLRFEFKRNQ